jgi:Ran GTPase-activating protein (RanGAP) involved in mRNA processing and transport
MTELQTLKLTNNQIENDGGKALGKALQHNKKLQNLDLRLNYLGDEGGYSLMVLLLKNKTLKSLELSGNGLERKSVTAICAMLKSNSPELVRLDLSCNKLGDYSTKQTINTGSSLNLAEVKPVDPIGKEIFEAISQNKVAIR